MHKAMPANLFDRVENKQERARTKNINSILDATRKEEARARSQRNKASQQPPRHSKRVSVWSKGGFNLSEAISDKNDKGVFAESGYDKKTYTSFSGVDTTVAISFPGGTPIVIGEAQTVTYSMFRPMEPVYNLGNTKPAGYVRGQRTIAGSIIFTVFDRNVMMSAFYRAYKKTNSHCTKKTYLTDELPPFDIHMTFLNEFGQQSFMVIHDTYITSEGQVMSIEDMITENTMQYLATDITLMRSVERK